MYPNYPPKGSGRNRALVVAVTLIVLSGCGGSVSQVPLRRVVLYQNGIGYFERSGELDDDELRMRFRDHEADDALKTLIVVDRAGPGRAGEDAPLAVSAVVPQPPRDLDDDDAREDSRGVDLSVQLSRPPAGELFVAYAIPTPTWRAVYRVVLPDSGGEGQGLLQAFALVNNVSEEDWDDVELVLATGAPFTYAVDLRTPRFVPRPDVTGRLVEPSVTGAVRSEESRRPAGGDDEDGVPEATDLCPDEPEDLDGFEDDDGCPDEDNDQDRILDRDDECPNEPEVYNGTEDDDGCPDHGRVEVVASNIVILDKVYFSHESARIRELSHPILDAVAATLQGNPQLTLVEIAGHAADDEDDPWGLSAERAGAVRNYLVGEGVQERRLQVRPYGDTQPIDPRSDASARERNRRVEFTIRETLDGPVDGPPRDEERPVTVESLERSSGATVEATASAEGTRYVIERHVSIPAGSSTLITLVNRPIPAEDVMLYRPDAAAPGSDRHPFRAALLANETGLDLVAGPLSLFARGTFVGEGLMNRIPAGDTTFVPYSVDDSTWVRTGTSVTVEPHRIIALSRGVLVVEDIRARRTQYRLDTGSRAPSRVFIRHRPDYGYEVQELPPGTVTTADGMLIPLPLTPGRLSQLNVVEHQPERRRIRLLDDRSTLISAYLEASALDERAAQGIRRIIELRDELREIEEQSGDLREQLGDLGAQAAEIRSSLEATESERRTTSDLRRRLLQRLEQATSEREGLSRRLAELTTRQTTRRAELSEALREITIEERDDH